MNVSVFDLFKMGVGPSSSHTLGPMTAACRFLGRLKDQGRLAQVARVEATLYASLALTGRGHATDRAVILGLAGFEPRDMDPDLGDRVVEDLVWSYPTPIPENPRIAGLMCFLNEKVDLVVDGVRVERPVTPWS